MMKKLIYTLITVTMTTTCCFAENINKLYTKLNLNTDAISISVKDIKNGSTVYKLNENRPMQPASTLKLVTTSAATDTLGYDYTYITSLYKSTNNDLYLKLSGDPILTSRDLSKLISTAAKKNIIPKNFYIDDTSFDKNEWGEGWQWDDELNPLMPKYSIYNIDNNLLEVIVHPTNQNTPASIEINPFYPIPIMNYTISDFAEPNTIELKKSNEIASGMLNISGTISKEKIFTIPTPSPKLSFHLALENSIRENKLRYYSKFNNAKLPNSNIYLVEKVENGISDLLALILKNSDNLVAETLFKTAGAEFSKSQGCIENSLAMLNTYLKKNNLDTSEVRIVDGSGVSKNNLMTTDFMSSFLTFRTTNEDFENFYKLLPTAGEGTLKNRMLYFKDNLRAKTGTLSNTSSIAGYLTTIKGKTYAFSIMMNDAKTPEKEKKFIEEQILRHIYINY